MGSTSIQRFGICTKLILTFFNFISSGIVGSQLENPWEDEIDHGISLKVLIFGSVIEFCMLALILVLSTCTRNDHDTLLCACEK